MSEILTMPNELEEYESEEDILEAATEDADEVDDEYRNPFPPEYVVGQIGHRGGGKSALLAFFLFNCLDSGDTVFTNLELHPEKLGIKNQALPLDQDHLLKFDPMLQRAVLGIDEIGTWFDRFRAMSTTSILQSKFLELVIRKQGIRLFYTNQSSRLPGPLVEQTDVIYQGYDVFFCDWARETNIAKGTTFLYNVIDRTGIFGQINRQWRVSLRRANRLWDAFNSYKVADPYAWARKTIVKGGEYIKDLDSGETFPASEEGVRAWRADVAANSEILAMLIAKYKTAGLIRIAESHDAIKELPDRLVLSVNGIRKGLVSLTGAKRTKAEKAYNHLRVLANQGVLAQFANGQAYIELAKPVIMEGSSED